MLWSNSTFDTKCETVIDTIIAVVEPSVAILVIYLLAAMPDVVANNPNVMLGLAIAWFGCLLTARYRYRQPTTVREDETN